MRCNKAQEYLSLEIDGLLPPDTLQELDGHLETCAECVEYRSDLQLGQRLLAATEPELPENFEWKLRLKLNQTIREAAGRSEYPWHEEPVDKWRWFRNVTSAAAVGLAAVLSVAMFMGGPGEDVSAPAGGPDGSPVAGVVSDRLPLEANSGGGARAVSSQSPFMRPQSQPTLFDRSWSGGSIQDLRTINNLRVENQQLTNALIQGQIELRWLRAQLDTSGAQTLDLEESR